VLVDSSPFRLIDSWMSAGDGEVHYGPLEVVDTDGRWSVVWMRPLHSNRRLHLAPCSVILTATLMSYLGQAATRSGSRAEYRRLDPAVQDRVAPVIKALLRHEAWFDFAAEQTEEGP
jgi:hypothetical protein